VYSVLGIVALPAFSPVDHTDFEVRAGNIGIVWKQAALPYFVNVGVVDCAGSRLEERYGHRREARGTFFVGHSVDR
jgi:hypothetical protein